MKLSEIKDPELRAKILSTKSDTDFRPVAGLSAAVGQRHTVVKSAKGDADEKGGARRVVVSFVCFRSRTCDDDNLQFGCKWLRDAIANSLGIDDGDKRFRWQYGQLQTNGPEGVAVTIQIL